MKRNTVLLVSLVVVLGLIVGAWLAFEPAGKAPAPASVAGATASGTGAGDAGSASEAAGQAAGQTTAEGAAGTGGAAQPGAAEAGQPAEGTAGDQAGAGQETATTEGQQAAALPAADAAAPAFDVVRVEKDGSTVIAGRAEPGAEVKLLDGEQTLATVTASRDGSFAVVLDQPLAPGSRTLSLSAENGDGQTVLSSNEVVVVVPEPAGGAASGQSAAGATGAGGATSGSGADTAMASTEVQPGVQPAEPIVVITSRDGSEPSSVIQVPGGGVGSGPLKIGAVDYDLKGQVAISGKAPSGGLVLVYLDDKLIGQSTADAEGAWSVTPTGSVTPGLHRLRADLLDGGGKVTARAETPFSRAEPLDLPKDETFVVVQPGNNLWLIARGHYGRGVRYTAIYEANADQIRDPDLIYPGQIFLIPQVN